MAKHHGRHKAKTRVVEGWNIREVRPDYFLVDRMISGTRIRKAFSALSEAETYCRMKAVELRNRGAAALDLSDSVRHDALAAMKVLEPLGVTLLRAAKEYAMRHPATAAETFRQTCDRYLVAMSKAERRKSSIEDKQGKLARLCDGLGGLPTAGVDTLDVEQWIEARGYRNGTARAYLGAAKTILAFFRGENRQKHTEDKMPAFTWGPEIVEKIMRTAEAEAPDLVAALAILFFAGIRPDEVKRLTWDRIDMESREIYLDGSITKTRTLRHVPIEDNLVLWLNAYRGDRQVAPSAGRFRNLREKVTKAAGLDGWPTDVARHTYATALYRTTGDVNRVMSALGHFGNSEMFVNHYKGVPMTGADAKRFFEIKPSMEAHRKPPSEKKMQQGVDTSS